MRVIKKYKLLFSVILTPLLFLLVACGGNVRNDQGVSFTFLGWFSQDPDDPDKFIGTTTLEYYLSDFVPSKPGSFGQFFLFAALKNNLGGQFIRTDRIEHKYFIPGAGAQPRDTVFTYNSIVGPAAANGSTSNLPDSFNADEGDDVLGELQYAGLPILSADTLEFIRSHRGALPGFPFSMYVTSRVYGVTSAGNKIASNEMTFQVVFFPDSARPVVEEEDDDTTTDGEFELDEE